MIELFPTSSKKNIYIITGGTMQPIAPHYSICAPAYGTVGNELENDLKKTLSSYNKIVNDYIVYKVNTRMAGNNTDPHITYLFEQIGLNHIETNDDLEKFVDLLIEKENTRSIIMAAAICDFKPEKMTKWDSKFITKFGKEEERLSSKEKHTIFFEPTDKIINKIRKDRKDIFLVSFKTTSGLDKQDSYAKALRNLKKSSSNLVFVNDIKNKHNGVVTPEEFTYWEDTREKAINTLSHMILKRIQLNFERTKIISNEKIPLEEFERKKQIPQNFLDLMRYLIKNKAFKRFNNKTAGHFGCKIIDEKHPLIERLNSIRKVDHNLIFSEGMGGMLRERGSDGKILFVGGKPSVGEHTQNTIYEKYGDKIHSIVHFHCPIKEDSKVPVAEQKGFECGSKECAENTSNNMKNIGIGIYAVHLKGHGPNIAFHKNVNLEKLTNFIENNWDLTSKTGGKLPQD